MYPENWQALQVFLACATQWRFAAHGRITGLEYSSLESVMRMQRVPARERGALADQVRVLEASALKVFNSKR